MIQLRYQQPSLCAGAVVGLLVSLPDAFAVKSYMGILGTGLLFGAMTGWATQGALILSGFKRIQIGDGFSFGSDRQVIALLP
jgi:hypothetical protein